MRFHVFESPKEASVFASNIIAEQIKQKEDTVLGLATGSTPIETYQNLIDKNKNNEICFAKVRTVNLDEYVGLSGDHEQSYRHFMNTNLFDHVNIKKENTHVPLGDAEDLEKMCKEYEKLIQDLGGIDLQVLGIGNNGHIGFNEPDTHLYNETHVTDLTESTIEANKRFFESKDEVPRQAVTMGMASILRSKHIIVLAFGASKADMVKRLKDEYLDPQCPVTFLKIHENVDIIFDKDAGSKL